MRIRKLNWAKEQRAMSYRSVTKLIIVVKQRAKPVGQLGKQCSDGFSRWQSGFLVSHVYSFFYLLPDFSHRKQDECVKLGEYYYKVMLRTHCIALFIPLLNADADILF